MQFFDHDIKTIFHNVNKLYGSVMKCNDSTLKKYYKSTDDVLNVSTKYGEVLEEGWGPGIYYTIYGIIYRKHKFDKDTHEEWLQDFRISPICFIPYESVHAIEGIESEAANMPVLHYEELKVLAIVSQDTDVAEGKYTTRDILFDDTLFSSLSTFKKFLMNINKTYGWIDAGCNPNILTLIQQKNASVAQLVLKNIPGVTYLGMHKDVDKKLNKPAYYYVGWGSCLDKHNKIVNNYRAITSKLEVKDVEMIKAEYTKIDDGFRENIFKFNDTGLCALIIGTISGFFLKERLRLVGIKYPILGFIGLSGAGKSATLENILIPIMGQTFSDILMAKSTREYSLIKRMSSHNIIPCIITEYKPDELNKFERDLINNVINNCWDGASMTRGKASQGTNNYYTIRSPLILVGEGFNGDKSKIERMIITIFNEMETREFPFKYLSKIPETLLSVGKMMLMRALAIDDDTLLKSFEANKKYTIEYDLSDRCEKNLLCALAGLDLFCEVCGIWDKEELKMFAVQRYLTDTLVSKGRTTNAIESILDDLSNMSNEKIISQEEWVIKDDYLFLNLSSIYPKYLVYLKARDEKPKLSKMNFEQQSMGFKTVIKKKVRLKAMQNTKWCIGFDIKWLEELSEQKQLDYSGFNINVYNDLEREAIANE